MKSSKKYDSDILRAHFVQGSGRWRVDITDDSDNKSQTPLLGVWTQAPNIGNNQLPPYIIHS